MTIKLLTEIGRIQENPTKTIGTLDTPSHLVREAVDNSIDELTNNRGSMISV